MSTETIESRSPQDQSDVVVSAPAADREAVAAAVQARARGAARVVAQRAGARRRAVGRRRGAGRRARTTWSTLMVREVGKPLTESVMEHGRAVRILRYQAQSAMDPDGDTYPAAPPADPRTLLFSRRRPRGVAGLITPWNFPFAIPLWKAAPALAYGNTVVLEARVGRDRAARCCWRRSSASTCPRASSTSSPGRAPRARRSSSWPTSSPSPARPRSASASPPRATARGIASQAEMGGLNASIVLPGRRRRGGGEGDRGRRDGLRGPEVHRDRARDRARRPGAVHRRAGRRGRGAADRRSRRREHGRRPGDQPAGARRAGRGRARRARATAAGVVTGGVALDGPGLFFTPDGGRRPGPVGAARAGGGLRADRDRPARRAPPSRRWRSPTACRSGS